MIVTDGSSGCSAESEDDMRIVDVAVRQCYRFNCPNCGSKLEADCDELVDIGGKVSRFFCPVCREERYIPWSALRKRTVYEDRSADYAQGPRASVPE